MFTVSEEYFDWIRFKNKRVGGTESIMLAIMISELTGHGLDPLLIMCWCMAVWQCNGAMSSYADLQHLRRLVCGRRSMLTDHAGISSHSMSEIVPQSSAICTFAGVHRSGSIASLQRH